MLRGDHTIFVTFVIHSQIQKQVDKTSAGPGEILTYTISGIGYSKSNLLTNVTVTDAFPAGTTYVANSDTPEATEGSGGLTWNLGSNTAGLPGSAGGGGGGISISGAATSLGVNNASSITFSHTPGAGTNRLMLVGISWSGEGTARTVTGVTFGGTSLTPVGTYNYTDNNRLVAIYSLKETFGTTAASVVVNFSGAVWAYAGAVTFAGVDQTTPLGAFSGAAGNSTTPSVGVTTASGDLVFDTVAANNNLNNFNVGASQSQQWNVNQQTDTTSGIRGAASTEPAPTGGGAVTMSWTTSSTTWAIGAVPIKPATGGTRTTTLSAYNTLVSSGGTITLEATFTNTVANDNVLPGNVTTTAAGGASCSNWTGPTLITADDDISGSGDPVTYRWTCTATGGTSLPSSLTFNLSATGDGSVSYPSGSSNSVLVAPNLSFQVTINSNPGVTQFDNTATLTDNGAYLAPTISNTATTSNPTAVVISSFQATWLDDHILITWKTASEEEIVGFNLWRAEGADPFVKLNVSLIPAHVGSSQGYSYSYQDLDVTPGFAYYYKLEVLDIHGESTFHGPVPAWYKISLPLSFR